MITMAKGQSWIEDSRIGKEPTKSLTAVLKTRGCSWARENKPCRHCSFHHYAERNPKELGPDRLSAKLGEAVGAHPQEALAGVGELKIYNGGSLLSDKEVTPGEREAILSLVGARGFRRLLIEARPEHVTIEKLQEAKRLLPMTELEVAIGLETCDDRIRAELGKGFALEHFEQAVSRIAHNGASLGAYVLVMPKPMEEVEAYADAMASLNYLSITQRVYGMRISARIEPFVAYEGMTLSPGHHAPALSTMLTLVHYAPDNLDLFLGFSRAEVAEQAGWVSPLSSSQDIALAVGEFNSTGDKRVLERLRHD